MMCNADVTKHFDSLAIILTVQQNFYLDLYLLKRFNLSAKSFFSCIERDVHYKLLFNLKTNRLVTWNDYREKFYLEYILL